MATGALDDADEQELVAYKYGDDFPDALSVMTQTMLGGRPVNKSLGPVQQLKILAAAAEFRAATPRRPGKGKPLPQSEHEGEMELKSRKDAQKACRRLIMPKPKHETSDAFIRRLDAHRAAPEALIVPMTPPEDEGLFIKRCVTIKANPDEANHIILPKTSRESAAEFEERLAAAKKTAVMIFPRGQHESNPNWKSRLAHQLKCGRPILPKSEEEGDHGFKDRMEAQIACSLVIHPFDGKKEDEAHYYRRIKASRERTQTFFEPGDHRAVDAVLGKYVEKEVKDTQFGEGEHHVDAKEALRKQLSAARHVHEAEEESAKELEEQEKKRQAEERAKEEEEERVAARIAEMKLKQEEERKAKEAAEEEAKHTFGLERVEIGKVGFMPLKRLLMERGVPKEQVFACANKFALIEVAKKWGPELKIEFVDETAVDVS